MIRKRLELANRLLSDTGSIFVQISAANQHLVRVLLDEIFGQKNFMWQILFRTKGGGGVGKWPSAYDYILWYAKDREAAIQSGKVHQLWEDRTDEDIKTDFASMQLNDGTIKSHGGKEIPHGARYCKILPLHSQGESTKDRSMRHTFPNGTAISPPDGDHWRISHDGLDELYKKKRLHFTDKRVSWIFYPDDAPKIITNLWEGMQRTAQKKYVVETKDKVLERCIQMCSDVGDLVLDITSGSGVTAYVAEKWGRRWIACDTSRVSLATTRWRLQTCAYPWYKLTDEREGVDSGFEYESFSKLSAKTLTDTEELERIVRYNRPKIERERSRVTGPFTIESIPAPTVSSKAVKTVIPEEWIPMLENSGITTKTGRRRFDKVERNKDALSPIHAFGITGNKKTAISFGPEYGPMGRYQVDLVLADLGQCTDALFIAMTFDVVAKIQ